MRPNPRIAVPLAAVAVAAIVWLVVARSGQDARGIVAPGTVEATEAQLGFQAPGRIASVSAREGDFARAGTLLAVLDRSEAEARRAQAAAQVAAARALLRELERGSRVEEVAQARAALDAAQRLAADAQRDLERMTHLIQSGAVSQEAFDKARLAADVAKSLLQQADEQYRIVRTGPRRERIEAQRAQLALAEAALRAADAVLDNMAIRAPFDGVVTVRHREPGEVVPAGSPVLSLLNRDDRWVRIYVSEARVGAVRLGQKVAISTDTFRGKSYPGEVISISSEAEFTPKNVQTTEERVKLVYAVKVRVDGDKAYDLKPGMPADVKLALAKP